MMEDRISKAEKQRRFRIVNNLQNEISWQKNRSYIGRCVTVLVEGRSKKDPGEISGRTDNNKVVNFPGGSELIGKMVSVKIVNAGAFSLKGELQRISD
jgi:tRNA-2-methylthio-N6-dimethylallyladenosine synthase